MANCKYWRPQGKGGQWRWIMFDTDLAFELNKSKCPGHHNSIEYILGVNNCHLPLFDAGLLEATLLFRKMLENNDFKKAFLNRYINLLNSNFSAYNVTNTIDEIKEKLAAEMPRHIQRWSRYGGIRSMDNWNKEVQQLYQFAAERPDTVRKFLSKAFDLGNQKEVILKINNSNGGTVTVNNYLPTSYPFKGTYFEKLEIELAAVPKEGYIFSGWKENKTLKANESVRPFSGTLTAIFEKIDR